MYIRFDKIIEEENIINDLIVRFLKKLNINNALRYEGLHFVKTAYNKENDRFVGVISCPKLLSYRNAVDLIEGIKNSPFKCDIHFEYESKYTLMEVLDFLKQDFLSQGYKEEEFQKLSALYPLKSCIHRRRYWWPVRRI